MGLTLEERIAEKSERRERHHRFARQVAWRTREIARSLFGDPVWRDRGMPAIVAEAAVITVEQLRRDGEFVHEAPPDLEPRLVPLRLAWNLTEPGFTEGHEAASTKLATVLRLCDEGKAAEANEALQALLGSPLR